MVGGEVKLKDQEAGSLCQSTYQVSKNTSEIRDENEKMLNRCLTKYKFPYLIILIAMCMLGGCWHGQVRTGSEQGVYYVVQKGDTLYSVARDHHVGMDRIAEANNLSSPESLKEGTVLFIPGASTAAKSTSTAKAEEKTPYGKSKTDGKEKSLSKTEKIKKPENTATGAKSEKTSVAMKSTENDQVPSIKSGSETRDLPDRADTNGKAAGAKETRDSVEKPQGDFKKKGRFAWPVKGKVVSHYGRQPNGMFYNGIRIETEKESTVGAARSGHVVFSAQLRDYGETIIIKHDQNYATVYTHLGKRLVRVDQRVNRGDKIAVIKPSLTSKAYLDFEIRYENKANDPLEYL
jgi:lipoprotein NlpD